MNRDDHLRGKRNSFNPLGLYSLSGRTPYRKISWYLEAARFGIRLFQSLWNLTSPSAANFRTMRSLWHSISRLRDFTRFGGKASHRLVNRGPGPRICQVIPAHRWRSGDACMSVNFTIVYSGNYHKEDYPNRHEAIAWTNADMLWIGTRRTKFTAIDMFHNNFSPSG